MPRQSPREALIANCLQAANDINNEFGNQPRNSSPLEGSPLSGYARYSLRSEFALIALAARTLAGTLAGASSDLKTVQRASSRLDDLIYLWYGKFHAYRFEDLKLYKLQLYTDASILKFGFQFAASSLFASQKEADGGDETSSHRQQLASREVDSMVETLDLALIRAGGAGELRGRKWIGIALELLEQAWDEMCDENASDWDEPPAKRVKTWRRDTSLPPSSGEPTSRAVQTFSDSVLWVPPITNPIPRHSKWDIVDFEQYVESPGSKTDGPQPIIFTDLIATWPALTTNPWRQPSYLLSRSFGGRRLVPAEIGRSYVDADWGQEVLPFRLFLERYIDPPPLAGPSEDQDRPTGYLAQHDLLAQIPSLRRDIAVPDFCYAEVPTVVAPGATKPAAQLDSPAQNAWFGPRGTITPLHTDGYHNLLCQVVGTKYVRLYGPSQTLRLRPRGVEDGVNMGNTSGIDVGVVEGWDVAPDEGAEAEDWSEFRGASYVDCILRPGDTLYIPAGWWHYVRSLSVSFSVSFWWN